MIYLISEPNCVLILYVVVLCYFSIKQYIKNIIVKITKNIVTIIAGINTPNVIFPSVINCKNISTKVNKYPVKAKAISVFM